MSKRSHDELEFLEDDSFDLGVLDNDNQEDLNGDISEAEHIAKSNNDDDVLQLRSEIDRFRRENESAKSELEREKSERIKAENIALKSAVDRIEADEAQVRKEIRHIRADLEVARTESDAEKVRQLQYLLDEKEEVRDSLKSEINRYKPLLKDTSEYNRTEKQTKDKNFDLAEEWYSENKSWFDDPEYADKRKKATDLVSDLVNKGYDVNSLKLWRHVDKQLGEFESKRNHRGSQPVMRGETGNRGSKSPINSSEDNRKEQLIKKYTGQLLKDMGIDNSMIKSNPKVKQKAVAVYNSVKNDISKLNISSLRSGEEIINDI
jgi:hypothetical protein